MIIYLLTLPLCHSERSEDELLRTLSEKSRVHKVGVTEILPPYGRLNDMLCQQVYRSLYFSYIPTQFHRTEVRAAHGAILAVGVPSFLKIFQRPVGVEREMELVAPTELEAGLA